MKKSVRKEVYAIIGIFILAFVIRFVYLTEMKSSPFFDTPTMDAEYHDQWAQSILKGEEFVKEGVFFRAPLYPYFLAAMYKIFGHDYFMARLIQFLIGSLSCVLVYLVATNVFNRRTAIIAGVMASLYGVLIYFDGELLIEILLVFLDLLLILACIRAKQNPSHKSWFFCGILLGLSSIARPNILLVGVAFFFWVVFQYRNKGMTQLAGTRMRKSLVYGCCLVLGTVLMVSPVTLRNYVRGHDFVLIASQGGMNFYIGNNSQSDGASAILPRARTTWWGSYEDAIRIAEKTTGRTLKPSEVSRFWYIQGLKFATSEPLGFLKLMLKKFILFWNGNELSNNKDFYFFARSAPLLKFLIWRFFVYFPFGLVAPLALVGVILSHKGKKDVAILEIFLLVYMITVIVFFVTERYRMPIVPILILFAAFAVDRFASMMGQKRILKSGKYLCILLVITILLNLEIPGYSSANPGQAYYALGAVYSKKKDMAKAEEEYKKAVLYNPFLGEAYANLAAIYGDQGKHELALENYEKALQNGTDSAFVFYNVGIGYYNQGFLDQAQSNCELSLSLREDDPKVHFLLGEIYLRKGMLELAIKEYKKTLEYDSQDASAYFRLGTIYRQLGRRQEAIDSFKDFMRMWKGDPSQIQNVTQIVRELEESTSKDTSAVR
ncbi:MAG: glycosyltransferase family 39 protein [Candidatus Zixiibacteriota bacterium]